MITAANHALDHGYLACRVIADPVASPGWMAEAAGVARLRLVTTARKGTYLARRSRLRLAYAQRQAPQ